MDDQNDLDETKMLNSSNGDVPIRGTNSISLVVKYTRTKGMNHDDMLIMSKPPE